MRCDKVLYVSKKAVRAAAGEFTHRAKEGIVYRPYWCSDCNGWHLTTNGKFKKVERAPLEIEIEILKKKYGREDRKGKTKVRKMKGL